MSRSVTHQHNGGHRSIAEVIAFIDQALSLDEDYEVRLFARSVTRHDGAKTGLVAAIARCNEKDVTPHIPIKSSVGFNAQMPDGMPLPTMPIDALNGAMAKRDGSVWLVPNGVRPHGLLVKNVRLQTTPFHYNFSEIEHVVVHCALERLDLYDYCVHEVDRSSLPGVKQLDYARVAEIRLSSMKAAVLRYVEEKIKQVFSSGRVTSEMQNAYDAWRAGRCPRTAIARTLKRAGFQGA